MAEVATNIRDRCATKAVTEVATTAASDKCNYKEQSKAAEAESAAEVATNAALAKSNIIIKK